MNIISISGRVLVLAAALGSSLNVARADSCQDFTSSSGDYTRIGEIASPVLQSRPEGVLNGHAALIRVSGDACYFKNYGSRAAGRIIDEPYVTVQSSGFSGTERVRAVVLNFVSDSFRNRMWDGTFEIDLVPSDDGRVFYGKLPTKLWIAGLTNHGVRTYTQEVAVKVNDTWLNDPLGTDNPHNFKFTLWHNW